MALTDIIVLFLSIAAVASAFFVAFHPNILHAAVYLVFTLLSVAGLYASLGADFLAGVQLIIYVGGIIIVVLFAIMMSENIYKKRFLDGAGRYVLPALISIGLLCALIKYWGEAGLASVSEPVRSATTTAIGKALVGPYALVFQYVAIVLLLGLIGAVIVARPHYGKKDEDT